MANPSLPVSQTHPPSIPSGIPAVQRTIYAAGITWFELLTISAPWQLNVSHRKWAAKLCSYMKLQLGGPITNRATFVGAPRYLETPISQKGSV